jgi:integrase
MPTHTILGGKVRLYRRGEADNWHASTYYQGKEHRKGTKTDVLALAEEKAEDWYLELRGRARAGLPMADGKPFGAAADAFITDYEASVEGQRSPKWIAEHKAHIENHLKPYFGKNTILQIDQDRTQEYRVHRFNNPFVRKPAKADEGKARPAPRPTAHKTIENEIITLRLILKFCVRKTWLKAMPDLSAPYKKQRKIGHRPWFAPEEYKALYKATSTYKNRNDLRDWERWNVEQLHDLILFLANTGLRPDEAKNLEHRDIAMVKDLATRELILEIAVRGKTGYGPCKSRAEAVKPYQRLLNRPRWTPQGRKPRSQKAIALATAQPTAIPDKPNPTDKVFPGNHIKVFNKILAQAGLKLDRDGKPHTFYSLRHFYICERLSEGADVYQLAKNCRTSVEMIQKHYAVHIMGAIDTAAVNARKPRQRPDENHAV